MKIPVILQARLASRRLPGKILLPILERPMLYYVIEALLSAQTVSKVVLAIPEDSYEEIRPVAESCNCPIVIGSENDVLERFIDAETQHPSKHIIRATADNPLVSPQMIDKIVHIHLKNNADLSHFLGLPLGSGVEVIKTEALFDAFNNSKKQYEREHVTPYIYNNKDKFTILEPVIKNMPDIKLTIDTRKDFLKVRHIFEKIYTGKPLHLDEVLAFYLQENKTSRKSLFRKLSASPAGIISHPGVINEKRSPFQSERWRRLWLRTFNALYRVSSQPKK